VKTRQTKADKAFKHFRETQTMTASQLLNRASWYRAEGQIDHAEAAEAEAAHLSGLQALEADAYALQHTNNHPRSTTAQNQLF
jgi:hypothetical protein